MIFQNTSPLSRPWSSSNLVVSDDVVDDWQDFPFEYGPWHILELPLLAASRANFFELFPEDVLYYRGVCVPLSSERR